jgi:hypothetical protein
VTCRSQLTVSSAALVLQTPRMNHRCPMGALLTLIAGISLLWVGPARAALGGDAASVLADAVASKGTVNTVVRQQYDIQEFTADSGVRVREYLNREGVVFAVSWSGPVLPDLQRLLGTHFAEYTAALAALDHPGLHRSVRVASSTLVVESGGHMRAYAGRAYLPALVPAGVSPAELP